MSILVWRADTALQASTCQHARALQGTLALAILALAIIASLIYPALDRALTRLGLSSDTAISIVFVPIGGLLSIYVSWAAIWGVLGSGRWLSRVLLSFLIAHLCMIASITITECLTALLRSGDPPWIQWREFVAMVGAFSYAFAAHLCMSMFLVWLAKLFRVRLLYFDNPASYPHPRRTAARSIRLSEPADTTLASGRISLMDFLGLITIFAVYLAAWRPIFESWLPTNAMFGPAFAFFLFLVVIGANGAIGLVAILIPLMIAMYDRWGMRTQIIWQGINLAAATVVAATWGVIDQDSEIVGLVAMALITFLANQAWMWFLMRRPSPRFRFRLVRN